MPLRQEPTSAIAYRAPKASSRSALTLLEVTIVMLIMGLMAAVAAPRFSSAMRASQVRSAAIQVASHVDYVRQSAINGNTTTTLTFDEPNASYQSPNVDFADRMGQLISVNLHEQFDPSIQMTADFDSANTIAFDVEGVPMVSNDAMAIGSITLSSPGVPSYQVIIAASTGYTSVLPETGNGVTGSQSVDDANGATD